MKSSVILCFALVSVACDHAADVPIDAIDASFLGAAKGDGTGIDEGSAEACAVLAAANGASEAQLDDEAGLDARAVRGIVAKRPFATLGALDAVSYVGPVAFERLLAFAPDAGFACGGAPATTCTAKGGTYDGVRMSAAAECKAIAFLDGARMSDMRLLTDAARRVAYDHCASGEVCMGYRFTGWTSMKELADWPGIGAASVQSVASAAARWAPSGGPAWDTVADVWSRRAELTGAPVTFEKVYVTRGDIVEDGASRYACVEIRDAPDAPNYLRACLQYINADSAPGCTDDPEGCLAPWVGRWAWMRGTIRRTSAHPGGYKVNLLASGPHAANPALGAAPGGGATVDEAWRAAAMDHADRLVTDGPLPAEVAASRMPAAAQARVAVFSQTSAVSVIQTYELAFQGHALWLVLATDGSGEGNIVWADLVDATGAWFAHGIAYTLWDGGGGLSWRLDEEDTTMCLCGGPGQKAVCTWIDGATSESSAIVCE